MTMVAVAVLRRVRGHALTTAAGALLVALAADETIRVFDPHSRRMLTAATIRQFTTPTSPTRIAFAHLSR